MLSYDSIADISCWEWLFTAVLGLNRLQNLPFGLLLLVLWSFSSVCIFFGVAELTFAVLVTVKLHHGRTEEVYLWLVVVW